MTTSKDWLPSNHEALYDLADQTKTYIMNMENRARMGFEINTPQGQWLNTVFMPSYIAFIEAYDAWKIPATRTPMASTTLVSAQKTFAEVFRKLYISFLKSSPFVTDTDLTGMGLPERGSGGHVPSPVPSTIPEAEVILPSEGVVEIHFRDSGAENKAKPAGVHGVEIAWSILETPPASRSDLHNSTFDTHTPCRLSFDIDQCGKRIYFALRWENTRGDKGPWSQIQHVVIP